MKDLGITKGEWKQGSRGLIGVNFDEPLLAEGIVRAYGIDKVTVANIKLIIDAGNTANKCGLLPSELLEQRDAMTRMLIKAQNILTSTYAAQTGWLVSNEKSESMWLNSPRGIEFADAIKKATE